MSDQIAAAVEEAMVRLVGIEAGGEWVDGLTDIAQAHGLDFDTLWDALQDRWQEADATNPVVEFEENGGF